jgi:hypothetical protein
VEKKVIEYYKFNGQYLEMGFYGMLKILIISNLKW